MQGRSSDAQMLRLCRRVVPGYGGHAGKMSDELEAGMGCGGGHKQQREVACSTYEGLSMHTSFKDADTYCDHMSSAKKKTRKNNTARCTMCAPIRLFPQKLVCYVAALSTFRVFLRTYTLRHWFDFQLVSRHSRNFAVFARCCFLIIICNYLPV